MAGRRRAQGDRGCAVVLTPPLGPLPPAASTAYGGSGPRCPLGTCGGCRNYLDQMRQTIRLVGSLSEDALPMDTQEELLRAFRGWKAR